MPISSSPPRRKRPWPESEPAGKTFRISPDSARLPRELRTAFVCGRWRVTGVPVPGGHLYLNDAVICTAAILLDPLGASFGAAVSMLLCFKPGLLTFWDKFSQR